MINLGELVSIKGGGTPSRDRAEYWNGNIPWASVKDITSLSLNKTLETITELGLKNSATNLYSAGTIIIPTRMALGKVTISSIDLAINQDLKALVINDTQKLTKEYLKYFLIAKSKEIELSGKGATVKGITVDVIKNLKINLPDLPTQTKIAQILDKADQIRQKRKKAIELADEFLRSLFLEMFGDPVVNPKGWEVEKLVNLSVAKPTYGAGASAIAYNHKFRYIRITDILENGTLNNDKKSAEIDEKEIEKYLLNDGDILFARSGATVGKTFLFTDKIEKSIYAGYLIRFQINKNKVLPEYIFNFTKTAAYQSWVKSHMKTVAQPNINAQQYSDLEIIIPPMEIQIKFVEIVNKIEKYKENLEKQVQFSDELFNSLSQQYFTKAE
ncbi:restriction endonuclease subunit S [Mannheimia sp. HC-2023]|uniref:restriction endonuclease subunit S n=1 Tax=Mannheimia indoligenes TaxID=3103145 RepID=UPI002FE59C27